MLFVFCSLRREPRRGGRTGLGAGSRPMRTIRSEAGTIAGVLVALALALLA